MYEMALFIHMLGLITLFIGFGILQRAGLRVRRAKTSNEAGQWLEFMRPVGRMLPSGTAMLFLSGVYMMDQAWTLETPWIAVGLVSVILLGVGSIILTRCVRALEKHLGRGRTWALAPGGAREVQHSVLWTTATTLNALALAVVLVMSFKPGWTASVGIALAGILVGACAGPIVARKE